MEKKAKLLVKSDILRYFIPALIIGFLVSLAACLLDRTLRITTFLFRNEQDARSIVTDFFLVEIQVTFIVVSLSTALSTQSKRIYWVDSFRYRLVKPKLTNFTALSSYILAALSIGILWEILDRCLPGFNGLLGVLVSFFLSLVFMIILSMRMIGANFGEEAIKRELEEELRNRLDAREINEHIAYDKGLRIPEMRELVQVTFQEIEEKQLDLVGENLDLMFRLGFPHELKRCYQYAEKTLQSPEIMEEIDFSLMRKAVLSNAPEFFFSDCPLSLKSLLKWWSEMIDERFDDATLLWQAGKKEEAMQIRKDLYSMLVQSLGYELMKTQIPEAGDEFSDEESFEIIELMGRFVEGRTGRRSVMDKNGEWISLGDDWKVSERASADCDVLLHADNLVSFARETLDRWEKNGCDEDLRMSLDVLSDTLRMALEL